MNQVGNYATTTAVTFDAGGTLLQPHPSVGAVYHEIGVRHGCALSAAELEVSFHAAFRRVSKASLLLDPEARERDFWRRIVAATFADGRATTAEPGPALFEELWEAFARGDRWRVLPGVLTTLTTLRARGYQLAVLSNWDHRLHGVLAETGLAGHFDHILISSEVGAEKPDAGIFRAAEQAFGVPPAQCLHIGDSRLHDRAGARDAGWQALLVQHADGAKDADHELARLDDLLPLLPGPDPFVGRGVLHSSPHTTGP